MARLGFDRRSGFVYEGRDSPTYPVWPNPVVSQATLISASQDFSKIPQNFESSPWGWVFREDSFDPVSKIRRGRLFQKHGNEGWEDMNVEVHPAIRTDELPARNNGGRLRKELSVFIECTELLQLPNRGEGARLALGVAGSYALWRIVQVESTLNLDVLVTLRAESAFCVLQTMVRCSFEDLFKATAILITSAPTSRFHWIRMFASRWKVLSPKIAKRWFRFSSAASALVSRRNTIQRTSASWPSTPSGQCALFKARLLTAHEL